MAANKLILAFVALLALTFAGQSGVRAQQRYAGEIFPTVTIIRDIAYGQAIDEHGQMQTLTLDLYQPEGDTETNRPVLIWIHGGGFVAGDKAAAGDADMATRFAKRGYVTASINYRLWEGQQFSWSDPELPQRIADAQHDAQATVRWFRRYAPFIRVDPDRIAVSGGSAGAITSLYVNYNSDDAGDSGNPGYPSHVSAAVSVAGMVDVDLVDADEPSVLLLHGTADTTVPFSMALAVVERATQVGAPVEYHWFEGLTHNFWWGDNKELGISLMSDFLYRQMIEEPAAPGVGGEADFSGGEGGGQPAWPLAIGVMAVGLLAAVGVVVRRRRR